MDQESNNLDQLAAALDGHQITDDEGQGVETETTEEKPAALEAQTTDEKPVEAEAPKAPQAEDDQAEAEDESGKRYIPKSRFDKVYGEKKASERKIAELEQTVQTLMESGLTRQEATAQAKTEKPIDKTEVLEVELLKGKLPQFDPESAEYSKDLDELGGQIYRANPGISRIEAARRALNYAKKVSTQVAEVRAEARTVKAIQSDQGITSHVTNRGSSQVDTESMSDTELENYLRQTGQW